MAFKKSARPLARVGERSKTSTTSLFVQNHTSPEHLLEQVQRLFGSGEIHQASTLIECIIENNHVLVSRAELFVLHAKIFIELFGFNVHAQCSIQQALLLEPEHKEAQELQALAQIHEEFRDGLYEDAQAHARTFIDNGIATAYAQFLVGYNLFWKNGADAEALTLLEAAVSARPSFLRAWLCLAMAYKKGQDLTRAENAFQECLGLDTNPKNLEFYKNHLQSI